MVNFIPEYDSRNVDQVNSWIESNEDSLSIQQLHTIVDYEKDHKNRITVLRPLADRLGDRDPTTIDEMTSKREILDQSEDDDESPEVAKVKPDSNYFAGRWYSRSTIIVPWSRRVEKAIERGDGELVQKYEDPDEAGVTNGL